MCRKLFLSRMAVFVFLSAVFVVSVDADSLMWIQTYGGTGTDYASSLVKTSDGGYAITGFTRSFGVGEPDEWGIRPSNTWLVKTDEFGNVEWNKTYERGGANSLVVASDGGYAITGGGLLVKTDEYGNMQWNKTYGGPYDDIARSLVETADGGYAIAGETSSFGAGEANVFGKHENFWLVKTDEFGNMEWNRTYGGSGYDWGMLLIKTFDGGYAIAGQTDSFGAGGIDFWLVKTDAYGNMEWNQTYGGQDYEWPVSLVETSDGGYAMAGSTHSFGVGSGDFLLIKTNELGLIPEPTSWLLPTLLLVATFVIIVYKKKR